MVAARRFLPLLVAVVWAAFSGPLPADEPAAAEQRYDVVVYGGSAAGIAAAVQVHRQGGSVVVIEPGDRIGGLTTGGLGQTDIGRPPQASFGDPRRTRTNEPRHWNHTSRCPGAAIRRRAHEPAFFAGLCGPHVAATVPLA